MSEIEVRKKIDKLLIVDDVNLTRMKEVLNICYSKASKMIEYLDDAGYLIEMSLHQKKIHF